MPCITDDRDYPDPMKAKLEAMLCAFARAAGGPDEAGLPAFLGSVNWGEAGVARYEFEEWWRRHKAADAEREKADALERKQLRPLVLAKLTPLERKVLGV